MGISFDTESVAIAVPIVGVSLDQCRRQWITAVESGADLVEWRLDVLEETVSPDAVEDLAGELRDGLGVPVLATYRTADDGGKAHFADAAAYRRALEEAARWADLIDVEISVPGAARIVADLKERVLVVTSFHDWEERPSLGVTEQLLRHMESLGAAVGKVAWMVRNQDDLDVVLQMQEWAADCLGIPSVVIGMGAEGTRSRLGQSAKRSAFVFARGSSESAPGQPTVDEIRASVS